MTIKDSGERRQFDTGAVRDIQEGKGRCDLMPLEVVSAMMSTEVLSSISSFQKTRLTRFLYLALEKFAIARYAVGKNDTLTYTKIYCDMFLEVSKHFEDGAKKYGENNWQKGIPVHCYIDSAIRHYLKYLRGDQDEPHDRAFVWNIMCCIWEVDFHGSKT